MNDLDRRYFTKPVEVAWQEAKMFLVRKPVWEALSNDVEPDDYSDGQDAPFLYLYSSAISWRPPIRRGDTDVSVPTNWLPLDFETRENLWWWAQEYANYDKVWLNSSTLEMAAYREMLSPASPLSIFGREVCAEIERLSQIPTYYYLARYYGKSLAGEARRRCPSCGKGWRFNEWTGDDQPFQEFHFKCDPCRLVSNYAVEFKEG